MAGIIRQANDQVEPEEDIELFRQSPQRLERDLSPLEEMVAEEARRDVVGEPIGPADDDAR
jgi:hypothetical protein